MSHIFLTNETVLLDACDELPGDITMVLYVLSCKLKTKLFFSLDDCNTHKELCKLQLQLPNFCTFPNQFSYNKIET